MQRILVAQITQSNKRNLRFPFTPRLFFFSSYNLPDPNAAVEGDDPLYSDVPKPRRYKSERKPYPTPMKVLIRRAKEEKEARKLEPVKLLEHPPGNGLLVPELVDVAHRVYRARETLLSGLSKLVRVFPIQRCRYCYEVHIGLVGHEIRTCSGPKSGLRSATHVWRKGRITDVVFFPKSYHLYDRVGKPRVLHDESRRVPKIPAVLELCIQAGVDLEKYPTKRRTKPVYSIEGRIVDFEPVIENDEPTTNFDLDSVNIGVSDLVGDEIDEKERNLNMKGRSDWLIQSNEEGKKGLIVDFKSVIENDQRKRNLDSNSENPGFLEELEFRGTEINETGRKLNLERERDFSVASNDEKGKKDLRDLSIKTLDSWFEMITGVMKMMEKYNVWTCGYCPEVQVGPKGHKVRMCKASKHQSRDGMHAWQEATLDDIMGPNYVWHVRDLNRSALDNNLKRYYGKAPAVVELCVHAGAPVPDQYRSMMRLDVISPERDEVDLVA